MTAKTSSRDSAEALLARADPARLFELTPGERRGAVLRDGALICYSAAPAREAPLGAILFVHGASSNASRWEVFFEKTPLRRRWTLLRLDLRAHGASDSAKPATLERHADDIAAVLDAEGIARVAVVGHSLGAHVAMAFAVRCPDRLAGLVLIDPLASGCLTEKALGYARLRPLLLAMEAVGRFCSRLGIRRRLPHYSLRREDEAAQASLAAGGEALEAFVKRYSSPWNDLGHMHLADYARDLLEAGRPTPPPEALAALGRPILVIASSAGAYVDPERLRRWTAACGGECRTVRCVHWPLTECPEEVSRLIADWIERASAA